MGAYSILHDTVRLYPRRAFGFTCLFLLVYQMLSVFWGFELCDSGFYMTFYDQIYKAPASVEYNFMYYLSGIVGGAFLKLFPDSGLLGIRLLGVANNMLVIWLLYKLFKAHISATAIIIGNVLIILSYIAMPMAFYYDLFTCLLYVLAFSFLFKGFSGGSILYFGLSGFIVAMNVFVRIPNILGLGTVVLFFIYACYYRERSKPCIAGSLVFLTSFMLGMAAVLLLMMALGHYELFISHLQELLAIAGDDSGSCSHTLGNMILVQLDNYYIALKTVIKLLIPISILLYSQRCHNKFLSGFLCIAGFLLLGCVFYISNPVFILCVFCLATPIGVSYFAKLKGLPFFLHPPMSLRRGMMHICLLYLLVCCGKMLVEGAYFDGGPMWKKTSAIHNKRARCIYTSAERAKIINDLLEGIRPYIRKNDCVLAYGSIPAINYLTETRPFGGCSWPEVLSVTLLEKRLEDYAGPPPVIIRQKFNSIGQQFGAPDEAYFTDCGIETGYFYSNEKSRVVNRFIESHPYKVAFENAYFVLYLPE